jgi:uncharacterized repeat protein (TIGR03803 family)
MKKDTIRLICFITLCLFRFNNINAQYTKLWDFAGGSIDGKIPRGSLTSDGTYLYGVTTTGGVYDHGIIFKIMPDGTNYTKLYDFDGINSGQAPSFEKLLIDGNYLYGMTEGGGLNGKGVIYKIQKNGAGFIKLLDFNGTLNGSAPVGALTSDGTYLYGTTNQGGVNGLGTIFKIKFDGTGYLKLMDFNGGGTGQYPVSSLLYDGQYLYGTSGTPSSAFIFKILTDGTGYANIYNASPTNTLGIGCGFLGGLIENGSYLYGLGNDINGYASVYKIKPDGSSAAIVFQCSGTPNGGQAFGDLVCDGTYLYGMTKDGGTLNKGIVFKVKLDGTGYVKMLDFLGVTNGSNPFGSLILDGATLYGMTYDGGVNSFGTIFKFQNSLTTDVQETKSGLQRLINVFPNPSNGLFTIKSIPAGTYYLTNTLGQSIKTIQLDATNNFTITIDDLPQGIYTLVGKENNQMVSQKIIVIQ